MEQAIGKTGDSGWHFGEDGEPVVDDPVLAELLFECPILNSDKDMDAMMETLEAAI